jgi:hypothetical protein
MPAAYEGRFTPGDIGKRGRKCETWKSEGMCHRIPGCRWDDTDMSCKMRTNQLTPAEEAEIVGRGRGRGAFLQHLEQPPAAGRKFTAPKKMALKDTQCYQRYGKASCESDAWCYYDEAEDACKDRSYLGAGFRAVQG